jgi:hypothetical protein
VVQCSRHLSHVFFDTVLISLVSIFIYCKNKSVFIENCTTYVTLQMFRFFILMLLNVTSKNWSKSCIFYLLLRFQSGSFSTGFHIKFLYAFLFIWTEKKNQYLRTLFSVCFSCFPFPCQTVPIWRRHYSYSSLWKPQILHSSLLFEIILLNFHSTLVESEKKSW